jgi:hypothetical protein
MFRTGRNRIVYSGTATWSAGSTATSAQTLTISMPASAGLTTLCHEIILRTNWTAAITADVRPVVSIGGVTAYLDIAKTITVSGQVTVKGLLVSGTIDKLFGLFNSGSLAISCVPASSASATLTLDCIVQEIEGLV